MPGLRRRAPVIAAVFTLLVLSGFIPAALGSGMCTVSGKFQYQNREFDLNGFTGTITPRPIRFADVRILDGDTNATLATGATAEDGTFSVTFLNSARNILVACVTSSTATPGLFLNVRVANDDYSFGDFYSVGTGPLPALGLSSISLGTVLASANTDPGHVFNLWDVAVDALQFVASPELTGSLPAQPLTLIWRSTHPGSGSFFDSAPGSRYIFVDAGSAYDDTVISHEVGHYIDDLYSKSDNPGGSHYLGDDQQDMRLSWAEGMATFLGSSIRQFKGYDRPDIYVKTDGTRLSFSYEIESLTGIATISSKTGSTNEIAVTAALWDITDGPGTPDGSPGIDDDPLERPFSDVWRVLTKYLPTVTRPITVESFWDGWLAPAINNGFLKEMQAIFDTNCGMEFLADTFEPDSSPSIAPAATPAQVPTLAPGPKVVINELDLGSVDAVELYNAGDTVADITNWMLEASAPGYNRTIFVLPSYKLLPGSFLILSEATGTSTGSILYFGYNVAWSNGSPGACVLKDRTGAAIDFVRWGGSPEPIPAGTAWAGPDPASPPIGKNLARVFPALDTDSGSDWKAQSPTLGTYNLTGQEMHHTFYPAGDVDYAGLYATAGHSYLLETLNLTNAADPIVEVLSTDGTTVLASNDDFGSSKASRVVWTAPSGGKYFVRTRRFDGSSNFAQYGSYDLRVMESLLPFGIAQPATLTVSRPGQGGKYRSVSEALLAASSGDTVEILDSEIYTEAPTISGKSVTLKSAAGKHPVIDGTGSSTLAALNISDVKTLRIEGLTVRGGSRGIRVAAGVVTIVNSVITGASDLAGYSDGIQVSGSGTSAKIINSTIVNNGRFGVGVFRSGAATIVNSIISGNGSGDIGGDGTATGLTIRNSLIGRGSFAATNANIGGDPQFVNAANGDFRLRATSPAIDRGDANDPDLPLTDADGIPRKLDGGSGFAIPDMGAYEYLPPGTIASLAIVPQVAAGGSGSSYRTSIIGISTANVPTLARVSLTRSDATPFFTGQNESEVFLNESGAPLYGGSAYNFSIAPFGSARFEIVASGSTIAGYASLFSSVPMSGYALFKMMSGNALISEAGVGHSKPVRNFRIYVESTKNAYHGYAIANYGANQADIQLTLRDSQGSRIDTRSFSLAPGGHLAEFAYQRFAAVGNGGDFTGSIEFVSDQDISAVALRYDNPQGDVFSTTPVLAGGAAQTLYFGQIADGGGYRTNFIIINPGDSDASATLEFRDDRGNPLSLPIAGMFCTSYSVSIRARGVATITTDATSPAIKTGWAILRSPAPLGGSAVLQALNGARIASEAGVASSASAQHLLTYVDSVGSTQSGLALCNPNQTAVTVTLKLRDASGQLIAGTSFDIEPLGHVARFVSDPSWFGGAFAGLEGTLEILATAPVCGSSLRYDNAVFAALPMIVIQ